ncbi:MAG: GAF domain-containing protein [Anaerolineae bacterium]|nr:GAF domain-containing protein [Anaerolineae bacterium]MDW8172937.1 adenylate/guanylate cyclase domain-containing protein [Anaerolineae bacterium]
MNPPISLPPNPPNPESPVGDPVQDGLRTIKRKVSEALQAMRQQSDLLRQRGIALPATALDSLKLLKARVDNLDNPLVEATSELRSLRALAQTASLINSVQSTEEVLNQVMDTVIALSGAERGYIVLKNKQTGELEFKVARGMDGAEAGGGQSAIISRTIVNKVADSGEPVLTDNASTDAAYKEQQSVVGFQLRSIMAVPLKTHNAVVGVVYVDNRFMAGLFKASDLAILTAFSGQAAVAIENAGLFETARRRLAEVRAIHDRMNNIFTSITSGILTLDAQQVVTLANDSARRIFAQPDLEGKKLPTLMPQLGEAFYASLARLARDGQPQDYELAPSLNGKVRHWYVVATPLRDEVGQIQGVALVVDDQTEQKTREAQLKEVGRYLPSALVDRFIQSGQTTIMPEEREITALFADVRGFTSFSERLQPEELMQVINKYLSLASDAINSVDGVVDKYMGDAVTGLFNTQLNPQEDHAARAVQAALQLITDLRAQHEVMAEDERLFYGIGIHSGQAVLGSVGGENRREFAVLGEAMDICKYLQEQADRGEIIISQATYELVKDRYECEPSHEVRRPKVGYENIAFYRVLRRKKGGKSLLVDQELLDLLGD